MLPGKKYKPEDLVAIAWRHKWLLAVPFVLVASATIAVSHFMPDRYRSETVILVVPQRVPDTYVRATVTAKIEDRLPTIQQTILSRTRLEGIIEEFNLYQAERRRLPMEDVIEQMRANDIQIQIVKGDAFKVAFNAETPRTAMQVAERLGSLFINESLQDRQLQATATSDFLRSQVEEARRRLMEQEQKVKNYRLRHAGELPTERDSNIQLLQSLEMQARSVVESINRDRDKQTMIDRALADLAMEIQVAPQLPVASVTDDPNGTAGLSTAARLEVAQAQLRNLKIRLTDEHPDVVKARRVVRDLEAKLQTESLERPLGDTQPARPATPEEAARQKRQKDLQAERENLEIQLKSRQEEEKRLRDTIAGVKSRLSATPIREAEMIEITRDYETLQETYRNLSEKQEDSKVAADLEQRQIGEQFRVTDHARLPARPSSPNRPLINLAGALAGLGFGLGLVAVREYRDRSMRSEAEVVSCLSLPVLALVPVMTTTAEQRVVNRRRAVLIACVTVALVVIAATGAAAWKLGWLVR